MTLTNAELQQLWIDQGGDPNHSGRAAAQSQAESGGNPAAVNNNANGTQDQGLWQINSSHGLANMFDPAANARAAIAISNNGTNWHPWCTAYSDGACGTRGGTYEGAGSPYLRYLQPNIVEDDVTQADIDAIVAGVTNNVTHLEEDLYNNQYAPQLSAIEAELAAIKAKVGA